MFRSRSRLLLPLCSAALAVLASPSVIRLASAQELHNRLNSRDQTVVGTPALFINKDTLENRLNLANALGPALTFAISKDIRHNGTGNYDPGNRQDSDDAYTRVMRSLGILDLALNNQIHNREIDPKVNDDELFSYLVAKDTEAKSNLMQTAEDVTALFKQPSLSRFYRTMTDVVGGSIEQKDPDFSCKDDAFRNSVQQDIAGRLDSAYPNPVAIATNPFDLARQLINQYTPLLQDGYVVVRKASEQATDPSKKSYARFKVIMPPPILPVSEEFGEAVPNFTLGSFRVDSSYEDEDLKAEGNTSFVAPATEQGLFEHTFWTQSQVWDIYAKKNEPLVGLALKADKSPQAPSAYACYIKRDPYYTLGPSDCVWRFDDKHGQVQVWVRQAHNTVDPINDRWDLHTWTPQADGKTLKPGNQQLANNDMVRMTHFGYQEEVRNGEIARSMMQLEVEKDFENPEDLYVTLSFGTLDPSVTPPAGLGKDLDPKPCTDALAPLSFKQNREAGLVMGGVINVKKVGKPHWWIASSIGQAIGEHEANIVNNKMELRLSIDRITFALHHDLPKLPNGKVNWAAAAGGQHPFTLDIAKQDDPRYPNHKTLLSATVRYPNGSIGILGGIIKDIVGKGIPIAEPSCKTYQDRGGNWCEINFDSPEAVDHLWTGLSEKFDVAAVDNVAGQLNGSASSQFKGLNQIVDAGVKKVGLSFLGAIQEARESMFSTIQSNVDKLTASQRQALPPIPKTGSSLLGALTVGPKP